MKAMQLIEPRVFRRLDLKPPGPPAAGQALVKTHVMGVCGTDISCYLGRFPFFDYPRIPGHELGVEVLAVGEGVAKISPGDRCSVEPYMHCGKCYACAQGATNCCVELKVVGVMMDGGLCDQFLIPAEKLHVSRQLNYEQLALVETLAIGCHAIERAAVRPGTPVLIIGAGPIGLATLEFAVLAGCPVSIMDLSAARLEFCSTRYPTVTRIPGGSEAAQAMRAATDGCGFPVVIDATGNANSMSHALQFVAPTGTLVYVGITTDEISFRHPQLHRPEMTLKASRNALPGDFTRIIQLIEDGAIQTDPWVTSRFMFDQVAAGFGKLVEPGHFSIKAMILVQGGE